MQVARPETKRFEKRARQRSPQRGQPNQTKSAIYCVPRSQGLPQLCMTSIENRMKDSLASRNQILNSRHLNLPHRPARQSPNEKPVQNRPASDDPGRRSAARRRFAVPPRVRAADPYDKSLEARVEALESELNLMENDSKGKNVQTPPTCPRSSAPPANVQELTFSGELRFRNEYGITDNQIAAQPDPGGPQPFPFPPVRGLQAQRQVLRRRGRPDRAGLRQRQHDLLAKASTTTRSTCGASSSAGTRRTTPSRSSPASSPTRSTRRRKCSGTRTSARPA